MFVNLLRATGTFSQVFHKFSQKNHQCILLTNTCLVWFSIIIQTLLALQQLVKSSKSHNFHIGLSKSLSRIRLKASPAPLNWSLQENWVQDTFQSRLRSTFVFLTQWGSQEAPFLSQCWCWCLLIAKHTEWRSFRMRFWRILKYAWWFQLWVSFSTFSSLHQYIFALHNIHVCDMKFLNIPRSFHQK